MGILYGCFWLCYVNLLFIFVVICVSSAYLLFMLLSYLYSSLKQTRAYPKTAMAV
jgi:hypothetical protein